MVAFDVRLTFRAQSDGKRKFGADVLIKGGEPFTILAMF